ncbi:Adhesion G protein-coupled receptor B3 [Lamellibrachia satsuma]|nr:Adhesion G protein-coupled receptor B3 [Lamellibrachia satsuma]
MHVLTRLYVSTRLRTGFPSTNWFINIPKTALLAATLRHAEDIYVVSTLCLRATSILPNHDLHKKSKEDNINSPLLAVFVQVDGSPLDRFLRPITVQLPYVNNVNISNPACLAVQHGNSSDAWRWSRATCRFVRSTPTYVVCRCTHPGIYAAMTDMYDESWDPGERPVILMNMASYIGCSVSALLCLFSFLMLVYLRTSSQTALIHKNFAVAIVCSQLSFMSGINRFQHKLLCHAFAVCLHYFFLATFQWLLNAAFNLYIVITYAVHSHGEHTDGGSQYRYYVLGWVQPAVIVGAFVGIYTDDYYATDM